MKSAAIALLTIVLLVQVTFSTESVPSNEDWLQRVPQNAHAEKNPVHTKAGTIAQGRDTFRAHCAKCHGEKAQGSEGVPALTTARVQHRATDGDLHWLL